MATSLSALEQRAKDARRQARKAWSFIFDPRTDPEPENFDQAVNAMVFTGAEINDIIAAITITAMRRGCKDHWSYVCGIVRTTVNTRLSGR